MLKHIEKNYVLFFKVKVTHRCHIPYNLMV